MIFSRYPFSSLAKSSASSFARYGTLMVRRDLPGGCFPCRKVVNRWMETPVLVRCRSHSLLTHFGNLCHDSVQIVVEI